MAIRNRPGKTATSYQVYWNNPFTGERESRTFRGESAESEAKAFDSLTKHRLIHEREHFRPDTLPREGDERTLEDALFLYLRTKQFSEKETERFMSATDRIIARIGHLRLIDITEDHLKDLKLWLLRQKSARHTKTKHPPLVSTAYVHGQLSKLRTILNWAVEEKLIPSAPKIKLPQPNYKRTVPPTPEEIASIMAVAMPHMQRVIILGAFLGTRVGPSELLSLTWEHVDLSRGVLRVETSKKNPSAPWREIPIRKDLIPVFEGWQEEDLAHGLNHLVTYKGESVGSIKTAWVATLQRAGITRNIRPYDLRHAFATQMIASGGADIGTVAELMGHSSPAMLFKTYQHVLDPQKRVAVESLPDAPCAKPYVPKKRRSRKDIVNV